MARGRQTLRFSTLPRRSPGLFQLRISLAQARPGGDQLRGGTRYHGRPEGERAALTARGLEVFRLAAAFESELWELDAAGQRKGSRTPAWSARSRPPDRRALRLSRADHFLHRRRT